jgi:hypothetical protein
MRVADHYTFTLALITGILAVTRVVRLIVDDTWPPMLWARQKLQMQLPEHWGVLVDCPWCVAPYVAVPAVGWFALLVGFPSWTWLVWVWWIVNGWAAVSWVAAWLTMRDVPSDQR